MIRWLLWLALALSLLFNVFFAAGYLKARSAGDETNVRAQVSEALELDDTQAAQFEQLRTTYHTERAFWDEQFADLATQLTSELARDQPDPENLRTILSRRADLEGERHRARAQHFSTFISTLSPEQCRRLAERMQHETQRHQRRRMDMFRRFDKNGDGELDDEEREAMERQRREWQRGHGGFSKRFDANGDGELDDEEREAMRAWMRENRGGRPGRGRGPGSGPGPGPGPR